MKSLQELWDEHDGRLIDKWAHYLPIYERYFAKFRGTDCRILEIGVAHGGSLQLWKAYFGKESTIVGVDIDPRCRDYGGPGIYVLTGNQGDKEYWDSWGPAEKAFDIVIDDGSHRLEDQAISFQALWPHVQPGGVYLIEDCHQGYPYLECGDEEPLVYRYPWVIVLEKPKRIVTGHPSRPLNPDELAAYGALDAKYLQNPK